MLPVMMQSSLLHVALLATAVIPSVGAADEAAEGRAFFVDQVYPILKENCFECHGGEKELKGDFRLTSREGLLHGGPLGPGYDEANPEASLLLEMISYKDEDHQMPPKKKLSAEQIGILRSWITRGATYEETLEIKGTAAPRKGFTVRDEDRQWWAYRPLSKTSPPETEDTLWDANGIDAFVRAQLDREGLTPNLPATPQVLIRRLTYDLIGLPPTTEEVEDFVRASEVDPEGAYRAVIDDLLSRPQYGEKWARHWLDLVRYGESNGFERDNPKPGIWRYRDYVVDAFNENLPYDQFVIEQLAGDEIEEPTMRSLIATGYHRLMQWDDEPADREQHVYDVLADNVQITSETFLATTLGCARCHDHKADPVSQKDYYAFMALFKGVTHYTTEGTIVHWADAAEQAAFEKERTAKLKALEAEREALANELRTALKARGIGNDKQEAEAPLLDDARGGGAEWFYTTEQPSADWRDVGFVNKSWYKGMSGFGARNPPNSIIQTVWETPEIWMRTTFGLTTLPDSLILEIHHDDDVEVYLNGALIHEAKGYTRNYEAVVLTKTALNALQTGKNVIAVNCRHVGGGQYIDLSLRTSVGDASSLEGLLSGPGSKAFSQDVKKAAGKDLVGLLKTNSNEIAEWRRAKAGIAINAVTERGPDPGTMNIHLRGSAHAMGEEVLPGLPAVLASADSNPRSVGATPVSREMISSSGRRLELAKWIVDPANALTARVIVNRLWQHHFGRGIVPSSSDFGHLGERPTHPELLDWLAGEFQDSGWDVKAMHRLILLSRTYRMSSEPDSGNLEKDPRNLNFWRFDMRRLTAEELRDSILAVSGNLNLKTQGEWVFPPLPAEVLATASRPGEGWPVSPKVEDHFRRSLYIHVKRSLRHQMLADFDQADTDSTCAVRFATTVPTQALTMLNSGFVNEQASIFADRMRSHSTDIGEQIAGALEIALQRKAAPHEVEHLEALYKSLQKEAGLTSELALDRIALIALNLNEFLYLD